MSESKRASFSIIQYMVDCNHSLRLMSKPIICLLLLLVAGGYGYIDITLEITTSSSDIAFNMPLAVGGSKCPVAISLSNKEEFLSPPKAKGKGKSSKSVQGELKVSSLQGYTLQGWRRFFIEVFTMADSRYYHKLHLDLSEITQHEKHLPLSSGVMTLGPQLTNNRLYQLIKAQTEQYFQQDIISFYSAPGGKELRMQMGGYEQQNARGYKNGVRFYERSIEVSPDGKQWAVPVSKLVIAKERGSKWDYFSVPNSAIKPVLSLQSQFVILPEHMKEDLETSLQTESVECSFSTASGQLQCSNISSVEEALTMLSFHLDDDVALNISLYDLRDQYNTKSKVTSFFVKVGMVSQVQLGAPLLRGYYISLNMAKPSLLFSPVNRFTPEITTVSILRFIIFFLLFMLAACICIVVWQQFNNPNRTRRFTRGKDGVKLVAYQRPGEFEDEF